jgi:DNA-directed RNA polymerase alpha subunit
MEQKMTKEEMLDQIAITAMSAQIQKFGITNSYTLAQTSYRMAQDMIENRRQIHAEWKREEEQQRQYATADLDELRLPIRYHRCLTAENVYTKERLCEWSERDLRRIPNMGLKGVKLIKEAMAAAGLKLKGQE